jgi:hypothetical protein
MLVVKVPAAPLSCVQVKLASCSSESFLGLEHALGDVVRMYALQ